MLVTPLSGLASCEADVGGKTSAFEKEKSHHSSLRVWWKEAIGSFAFDWKSSCIPVMVGLIQQECLRGEYPAPDLLADWKVKAGSWLRYQTRFHFAGNPTEQFSDNDLGIANSDGKFGENTFYRAFFQKLRELNGARTAADFNQLMDWLVQLDMLKEFPNPEIMGEVHDGFRVMRAELCENTTEADAAKRLPYDPNSCDCSEMVHYNYFARFYCLKFHLIQILLEEAPPELSRDLTDRWLHAQECQAAREWLFSQRLFPLNTFFGELYPWYAPLVALTRQLPDNSDRVLVDELHTVQDVQVEPPPEPGGFFMAFGRTLKSVTEEGQNRYLKIKSLGESRREFITNHNRLQVFRKRRHEFESETVRPTKIASLERPEAYLAATQLGAEDREKVLKKVGSGQTLAMEFTTPAGCNYEIYNYDVDDADGAVEGLGKYARDYGRLWRRGLLGPVPINAFHHFNGERKHVTLSAYIDRYNEGSIESWCHAATNYPNVGDGWTGMRDMGDTYTPDEITWNYFDQYLTDQSDPDTCNKLRLNELARTAEGLVLLYARRFNRDFDYSDRDSVQKITQQVGQLLTDLFSHAMPLDESECVELMMEHNLLEQCGREVSYWLAEDAPFVSDLRKAEINRTVYPDLPDKMRGCVLTEEQAECLTDRGFVDRNHSSDQHPQLGSQSGRNPLIALNALITKLILSGTIRMIQAHRQQLAEDAQTLERQQLAV